MRITQHANSMKFFFIELKAKKKMMTEKEACTTHLHVPVQFILSSYRYETKPEFTYLLVFFFISDTM